jgi:hypothetical protein
MDQFSGSRDPSRSEIAWELVELFDELGIDQLNEMVAKNVPFETLEFFTSYASGLSDETFPTTEKNQLPNLMLIGYLLRVLEERLVEPDHFDA